MNALLKVETMNATATAAPAMPARPNRSPLAEKAMLISLSIQTWQGRKLDKSAGDKVTRDANASADAARVTKALVSKTALADIAAIAGRARSLHYGRTLPWMDNGTRICSAVGYVDYMAAMGDLRDEFTAARGQFLANYDAFRDQARRDLGGLFDETDYPDATAIAGKFQFPRPRVFPIPDAADFRVDISAAELERTRAEMQADVDAMVADAMRSAFERVAETVGHMATKLAEFKPSSGKGDKAEGIFRDSLVDNVRELVDVLPSLNITGDSRLAELGKRMRELCGAEAKVLRDHADVRKEVAAKAAAIMADVSAFMA